MPASETPVTAAFIATVLIIAGIYNFIRTIQLVRMANRSKKWPWVYGKITHSSLEVLARVRNTRFVTELRYDYEVEGQAFEGYRLNARPRIWGLVADYARDMYPRGRRVQVYYNPERPQQALLEPGLTIYLILQLVLGPLLFLLGVWAALRLIIGGIA